MFILLSTSMYPFVLACCDTLLQWQKLVPPSALLYHELVNLWYSQHPSGLRKQALTVPGSRIWDWKGIAPDAKKCGQLVLVGNGSQSGCKRWNFEIKWIVSSWNMACTTSRQIIFRSVPFWNYTTCTHLISIYIYGYSLIESSLQCLRTCHRIHRSCPRLQEVVHVSHAPLIL